MNNLYNTRSTMPIQDYFLYFKVDYYNAIYTVADVYIYI